METRNSRIPAARRGAGGPAAALAGVAILLLAVALALGGCSKGKGSAAVPPATAQTQTAQAGTTGSAAAQPAQPAQPPIPVAVKAATVGEIASYYKATATLEPNKQAQILARVSGLIQSLACEEGDIVREGARLLQVDNQEYLLRVQQAEATTANLKARFDRTKEMLAQQLTSDQEFQTAKSELGAAEAEEGLARLNLSYTTVTAPFGGRVTRRLVDVGQNVSPGTPLFELADFNPLLARVHVPAKEFKKLQPDQPVELTLDSGRQRLQGRIKLISPVIDPQSGTIKVTVEIPVYPAEARPGDFTEVQIVTERHSGATLVPRIAVISEKGEDIVYVAAMPSEAAGGAPPTAERRVVTVGFTDNDNAEILSGLQPGESVVVKGQRSLKHGAPIKILDESAPEVARAAAKDARVAAQAGS
jgi:membrane fusion protein (multidrug efflux system)